MPYLMALPASIPSGICKASHTTKMVHAWVIEGRIALRIVSSFPAECDQNALNAVKSTVTFCPTPDDQIDTRDLDMAFTGKVVAYYRISTAHQGIGGLGIEAQRHAIANYLNGGDWEIVAEFVEVESGRHSDRPELQKALTKASVHKCPIVVAKVDRLTRNVGFLSRLLDAGVD